MKNRILISLLLMLAYGCSGHHVDISKPASNEDESQEQGQATAPPGTSLRNGEVVVKPGTMTASVSTANRALMSLVSCTGIEKPSPRARQMWLDKLGSFSVEGSASTLTAPMMMAQAAVAAEVCLDLVNKEKALTAEERRIFPSINFLYGPQRTTVRAVQDTTRRLARSCWGRNETGTELTLLTDSTLAEFQSEDPEDTTEQMVFLCAAMLSAAATVQM